MLAMAMREGIPIVDASPAAAANRGRRAAAPARDLGPPIWTWGDLQRLFR
jgi:hypothetical protein